MSRYNFVVISRQESVLLRVEEVATSKNFLCKTYISFAEMSLDPIEISPVSVIILDTRYSGFNAETAIKNVRSVGPTSRIIGIFADPVDIKKTTELKRFGLDFLLLEKELFGSLKFEFVVSQVLSGSYYGVPVSAFGEGAVLSFPLFHFMPINRKFIPFLPAGRELTAEKVKAIASADAIYLKRENAGDYMAWILARGESAQDLQTGANFLAFSVAYFELMMSLRDQIGESNFAEGQKLYERCLHLTGEMLRLLLLKNDLQHPIRHGLALGNSIVDRAPVIAAYAGMLSHLTKVGDPREVMMACLMGGVALLDFPTEIIDKVNSAGIDVLTAEQRNDYERYPYTSVYICGNRKIPLPEKVRNIIIHRHERADRTGFPKKVLPGQIPHESFLIHFAGVIENLYRKKADFKTPFREMLVQEFDDLSPFYDKEYTTDFVKILQNTFQIKAKRLNRLK